MTFGRIWSYSGLALEADYTDNALRERDEKVSDEITRLQSAMAFVDSEILLAPDEELEKAVERAKGCRVYLQDLMAKKPICSPRKRRRRWPPWAAPGRALYHLQHHEAGGYCL